MTVGLPQADHDTPTPQPVADERLSDIIEAPASMARPPACSPTEPEPAPR